MPSYQATKDEKDVTRGRARVLQDAINGTLVGGLTSPEVRDSLDLCLSCKACSADCPAGVDMAQYKSEVLHRTYQGKLRPMTHYALGWLPRWARLAGMMPRFINAVLGIRPVAKLVLTLGGMDSRREVPQFAEVPFRTWWKRGGATNGCRGSPSGRLREAAREHAAPGRAVDGLVQRRARAVGAAVRGDGPGRGGLRRDRARPAGLLRPDLDQHRSARRRAQAAREPAPGVGAVRGQRDPDRRARALVHRGPALRPARPLPRRPACEGRRGRDPHGRRAADATRDAACAGDGWTVPDLSDVTAVVQPHCHQHSVMGFAADEKLLRGAGATIDTLAGCCGLAGNFGMEKGHYEVSVQVAENALLPALRAPGRTTSSWLTASRAAPRPTSSAECRARRSSSCWRSGCRSTWSSRTSSVAAAWSAASRASRWRRRGGPPAAQRGPRPERGLHAGWAFVVLDVPDDVARFWSATSPPAVGEMGEMGAAGESRWLAGMRTAPWSSWC
ncbi:hypothetical protein NKG05_18055 [Oerskovia sp. M15]